MNANKEVDFAKQLKFCLASDPENVSDLGHLVSTLEALGSIACRSDSWKEKFWNQWGLLEEVYAVTLDKGQTNLDIEGQELVSLAITELRRIAENDIS